MGVPQLTSLLQATASGAAEIEAYELELNRDGHGQVVLAPYLVQLCDNVGASMIRDPRRLSIAVEVDDSLVDAKVSVSLGLIEDYSGTVSLDAGLIAAGQAVEHL